MSETLQTWTVEVGETGFVPDNTTLTLLYSSESLDGSWSPFSENESPASNNDGGVRIKMEYSGAELRGYFVRSRVLVIKDVLGSQDPYSFGENVRWSQGEETSGTMAPTPGAGDYYEIPKTSEPNEIRILIGPPGKATARLIGNRQEQQFTKQGIAAFADVSGNVGKLFKKETLSGSAPGYPNIGGRCEFTPKTDDRGITDPTGTFTKTDGVNEGRFARPPLGYIGIEKTFGIIEDAESQRIERDGSDSLSITLENEYTTDELETAVQDSLDIQYSPDVGGEINEGVIAKHFLSLDERTLWRVESQLAIAILDGHGFGPYQMPITIGIRYQLLAIDLLTGTETPSEQTDSLTVFIAVSGAGSPQGLTYLGVTGGQFSIASGDNAEVWLTDLSCDENERIVADPPFVMERIEAD